MIQRSKEYVIKQGQQEKKWTVNRKRARDDKEKNKLNRTAKKEIRERIIVLKIASMF